jgi:uroporphyrinogen-III synthase
MGRLEGIRVLVTRPRPRAAELCALLEAEGAEVTATPLLQIMAPEDDRPLREAAQNVSRYAWVVFASPSAVEAFAEATRAAGTFPLLQQSNLAVVGPKTAQAARELSLPIAQEAQKSTGVGLFDAIYHLIGPTDVVLLPAAEEGRLELKEALEAKGIQVVRVAAYRAQKKTLDRVALADLELTPPRVVLFASPRTAEAFLESTGDVGRRVLSRAAVIAIGPTTANALAAKGITVSAVADEPTSSSLVAAAARAIRG